MEPSRALLGSLASAAAAAQPGEDGAGAGAEEEEEEEEEAAAAPGDLGSDTPMPYWTAVFEYEAAGEDELTLRLGDVVEVLSKDSQVSGDEGWWTGQLNQRVGIFPSNYVTPRSAFSSRCQPGGEDPSCYSPIQCKEKAGRGSLAGAVGGGMMELGVVEEGEEPSLKVRLRWSVIDLMCASVLGLQGLWPVQLVRQTCRRPRLEPQALGLLHLRLTTSAAAPDCTS